MNKKLFLFFFAFTLNLFYNAPSLSATPIIGGDIVTSHYFKFHVSILRKDIMTEKHYYFCGGSIVHERYILTAAHCFIYKKLGAVKYSLNVAMEQPKIVAGRTLLTESGVERDIAEVLIPKIYNFVADLPHADIAVAKLKSNIKVDDAVEIATIGFLHPNEDVNKQATFCGFGYNILKRMPNNEYRPKEELSYFNRYLSITLIGKQDCPQFPSEICGRYTYSKLIKTACQGDSGAGLLYGNGIVGVLAHAPPLCDSNERPIAFTRISEFSGYVKDAMNEHLDHSKMYYVLNEHSVLSPTHLEGPSDSSSSSRPQSPPRKGRKWFQFHRRHRQ